LGDRGAERINQVGELGTKLEGFKKKKQPGILRGGKRKKNLSVKR